MVTLSALRTGRLYPQKIHPVLIFVRSWFDPWAIVRPEGICHWKIPVIPSRIERMTYRFVAYCRNHYTTARPILLSYLSKFYFSLIFGVSKTNLILRKTGNVLNFFTAMHAELHSTVATLQITFLYITFCKVAPFSVSMHSQFITK